MTDGATIFAPASGRGRAGIAVIRVSGSAAAEALRKLTGAELPTPRVATRRRLSDPEAREILDEALVLWFPAPASYTGEDVVELHLHGGAAVLSGVLEALAGVAGLRPADAGEFSRRAFLEGKLDLTEAEGLADLIAAETARQRRQALDQMGGRLGGLYEAWRGRLLRLLAEIEAEIDFAEEEGDVAAGAVARLPGEIAALAGEIARHLEDERRGERLRDGLQVAILGPPNAGKSSLLNALAKRDVAIVTDQPGTTRDVLEVRLDLAGYPLILADTAGLRRPREAVEAEGVRRARRRGEAADLRLVVIDAAEPPDAESLAAVTGEDALILANKIDVAPAPAEFAGQSPIPLSLRTGQGLDDLLARLEREAARRLDGGAAPLVTRTRHRSALGECRAALARALAAGEAELMAEDLRLAARAIGRITGRVDVEDILDIVFSEFCIGK